MVPVALVGTRDVMQPQHHKWPRLWKRFDVCAGQGVTWLDWLGHPEGGAMTVEQLQQLAQEDEHLVRTELAKLFRLFTDQLMGSLSDLGAP